MIHKRNHWLLATVAALALTTAGCGGGGGDGPITGIEPGDGDGMEPGDGDGDGMEPGDPPSPQALANAVDLIANDSRQEGGVYIGGWWWRLHGIGAQEAYVSVTHSDGGNVSAIMSHDENGRLQHNVVIFQNVPLQEADPWARAGRYINTSDAAAELEGATKSIRSISVHGLGSEWQVSELTSDYENAGTLSILVATDVQPSDGSVDPFTSSPEVGYSMDISGAPAVPEDQDFLLVWLSDGDSIEGSLDGDAGSYSCANAGGCTFIVGHTPGAHNTSATGVTFTPDGGTAQSVAPRVLDTVPSADYLAFGGWLYVPEDVADTDDYDFGVFAGGGDPFNIANLRALTGTATYEGAGAGMYYVNGLSSSPEVGLFNADVELTADFGDSSATGFISGEVNNFMFEGDVASSLPATVTLASRTYDYLPVQFGVPQGSTNIFDTLHRDTWLYPGGHVGGVTEANVAGEDWYGYWQGVFYGNGASPTDHPTSVGGTFGTSQWNDSNRSGNGLTGSFGAHRQ